MDKKQPKNQKIKTIKKPHPGYMNGPVEPRMGADGYLHCAYCKRRYEPGHRCNRQYK